MPKDADNIGQSIPFCQFQFQLHIKFINSNSIPIPNFLIPIPFFTDSFLATIFYNEYIQRVPTWNTYSE